MKKIKSTDSLLTFDEDSPLFIKKKGKRKKKSLVKGKPKTVKPKMVDPVVLSKKQKTKSRKKPKKKIVSEKSINKNIPKYDIKSPADCKHLLPVFKKKVLEIWKLLESENHLKVRSVGSYLKGVAQVANKRYPKEYEELKILSQIAKQIANKQYD